MLRSSQADTAALGFPTARLDTTGLTFADLENILSKAASDGIKLVFCRFPAAHPNIHNIVERAYTDNHFTDVSIQYRFKLDETHLISLRTNHVERDLVVAQYVESQASATLVQLGTICGCSSSYNMDPNISALQMENLFKNMTQDSVAGIDSIVVIGAWKSGDKKELTGMATLQENGKCIYIRLLAVRPHEQRNGAGRALMMGAMNWALSRSCTAVQVETSQGNFPARRLFESCGGAKLPAEHIFHFYIGSDVVDDASQSEIPNNKPYLGEGEIANLKAIFDARAIQTNANHGPACEKRLEKELNALKVLLVTSGTAALEMCSLLVGSESGVEIIMPSYTFVSTANAFVIHGATPVFVDIRSDTQNIDENKIEAAITSRTRAIVCVHYAGVPCEMDSILEIASRHKLLVVEDNAHGIFSTYKGRMLGTIGDIGALSFHYTKNIICGEGGAVVINRHDLIPSAMICWEKGTNRYDFLRGRVNKYAWVSKGSSYVMSEICAAVLSAQLQMRPFIIDDRMRIWNSYHSRLEPLERDSKLTRPVIPEECTINGHIYYIRVHSEIDFQRLGSLAREKKISIFTHYEPLHSSTGGRKYGRMLDDCCESTSCASQLYRLPLWVGISDIQIEQVMHVIQQALQINDQTLDSG